MQAYAMRYLLRRYHIVSTVDTAGAILSGIIQRHAAWLVSSISKMDVISKCAFKLYIMNDIYVVVN